MAFYLLVIGMRICGANLFRWLAWNDELSVQASIVSSRWCAAAVCFDVWLLPRSLIYRWCLIRPACAGRSGLFFSRVHTHADRWPFVHSSTAPTVACTIVNNAMSDRFRSHSAAVMPAWVQRIVWCLTTTVCINKFLASVMVVQCTYRMYMHVHTISTCTCTYKWILGIGLLCYSSVLTSTTVFCRVELEVWWISTFAHRWMTSELSCYFCCLLVYHDSCRWVLIASKKYCISHSSHSSRLLVVSYGDDAMNDWLWLWNRFF